MEHAQSNRPNITTRSAFTLIELLVVIAIIAVLAAILFPVFARARDTALRTQCLSNEKQIGAAFFMYRNDWDDTYPEPEVHDGVVPNNVYPPTFRTLLMPYLRSEGVFACPTNPVTWEPDAYNRDALPTLPWGYAMNGVAFGPEDTEWNQIGGVARGRPASDIAQPADTILMGEVILPAAAWMVPDWAVAGETYWDTTTWDLPPNARPIHTHDGFTNWLFCDGHARAMRVAQTLAPRDLWPAHPIGDPQERADWEALVKHILDTLAPEYR